MPNPGTVFQIVGEGNHPWITISPPIKGKVLAVNVTDYKHCPSPACILDIGDHPFITKKSAICYRRARVFDATKIDQELLGNNPHLRKLDDCSPALLTRIIEGARITDDLTYRFHVYLSPST